MTVEHMQRIDKYLSDAGIGSRSVIKRLLRSGAVRINGRTVTDPAEKLDETQDKVDLNGETVERQRSFVLILNKPAGFVTATDDPKERTVMELLPSKYRAWGAVPVGRLDKQTEGLLLFTNDGVLAHRLISPKYEIEKVYYARHEGTAGSEDVALFQAGITLKDGTVCRPAVLTPIGPGESRITVTEGKYHQVRRMMASRNMTVQYLRRDREGQLTLAGLNSGECRELTADELQMLMTSVQYEQNENLTKL